MQADDTERQKLTTVSHPTFVLIAYRSLDNKKCLWKISDGRDQKAEQAWRTESFESIYARFASPAPRRSFWQLLSSSLVVVQEIALTVYLLARHRVLLEATRSQLRPPVASHSQVLSTSAIVAALGVVLFYGSRVESKQDKRVKVRQRLSDALLSAIVLRLLARLLQSLTASYASDTLYTLAIGGLILHVVACDYSYANGHGSHSSWQDEREARRKRPTFHGGTVSLNSALFSTTLLVSRLGITEAYFFVYFAIVLFAFYPASRNAIASVYPASGRGALWLITALIILSTVLLLESPHEIAVLASILIFFGLVLPLWRFIGQRYKVSLNGPWDISTNIT